MTEESSQNDEVQLVIRSAYQSADDITFSCPKSWTIRQVKEHVKNVLSSHPSIATQRLIFSGASLQDDQIIENVLSQRSVVDGAQVFHLVISQPYTNQEVRRRPQASTTSAANPTQTSPPPSTITWEQWWAQYGQNSNEAHAQYYQYYNEYMRYYYSQQYYMSMTSNQNGNFVAPHAVPQPAQNNNPIPPGQAAPPGERVDALEIFYRLFKLVILFSAVLLYSSFERFALVLSAALFIYFIQLRRNHARNRAVLQAREQNAENNNVNNNNNGENSQSAETENRDNASQEENTDTTDPLDTPPTMMAPPPPSIPTGMQIFFSACYSFVTSFFASLVPDHPLPVDLN